MTEVCKLSSLTKSMLSTVGSNTLLWQEKGLNLYIIYRISYAGLHRGGGRGDLYILKLFVYRLSERYIDKTVHYYTVHHR